ncbi:PD40 domain-containing protein [bacterium]|nr:PD40 domain-containing protein [bacterium]
MRPSFRKMIFGALLSVAPVLWKCATAPGEEIHLDRPASIFPDYAGISIPPNIAPLNFAVLDPGERVDVRIETRKGDAVRISSRTGEIRIPFKSWRLLLDRNRGDTLFIRISVLAQDGRIRHYRPIENVVAVDQIDPVLVYRRIKHNFIVLGNMGIVQRNLENFDEKTVLDNKRLRNCMNCHSFDRNNPDRMLFHMRGVQSAGMILAQNGKVEKINTATPFNPAAAYASWHPSGKWIAFSVNQVKQFFHARGYNRDVLDLSSDLILYDIEKRQVTASPVTASADFMETAPAWSPDGNTLYFCRAPQIPRGTAIRDCFRDIRYDLMRIPFDSTTGAFGSVQTLLAASETGKSASFPRVSPDGRWLLFSLAEYGHFPVHHPGSDLYALDLKTGLQRDLEVNSPMAESAHAWSSNGRWIVFSSKRDDGFYARPYISHFDSLGKASKPFILPFENPHRHESDLHTYSVPELITGPVPYGSGEIFRAAKGSKTISATLDPGVKVDSETGASEKSLWEMAPYF